MRSTLLSHDTACDITRLLLTPPPRVDRLEPEEGLNLKAACSLNLYSMLVLWQSVLCILTAGCINL